MRLDISVSRSAWPLRRTSPERGLGGGEAGADAPRHRLSPAAAATTSSASSASRTRKWRASTSARASLHHELEHTAQVGLAADRTRDRDGRLEAAHGAFELAAAGVDVLVQVGVLDGDRHPAREHEQRLLVGLVELAALLLGQVDVAPRLAAHQHRGAEERRHRRVLGREAVAARVLADVGEAKRLGVADQLAEDAAAAGKLADRAPRRLVHCRRSGSARAPSAPDRGCRRPRSALR